MTKNQDKYMNTVNVFFNLLPIITFTITIISFTYVLFAILHNLIFQGNISTPIPIPYLFDGLVEKIVNVFNEANIELPIKLLETLIHIFKFLLFGLILLLIQVCLTDFEIEQSLTKQFFPVTLFVSQLVLCDLLYRFLLN